MSLNEYISILFTWINEIFLLRDSIGKDKKNSQIEAIKNFQAHCEFLYHSKIFRSILSYVYPIVHDHDCILYYLDKVSVHKRSLDLILKCLKTTTI